MMDLATFEDRLDRYGSEISAWPKSDRDAATTLLSTSSAARGMRDAMIAVERVLRDSAARIAPGAADQIAARAMRHRQYTPARRLASRAGWAAAAAIVLVVGVMIGDRAAPRDVSPDRVLAVALDPGGTTDVE